MPVKKTKRKTSAKKAPAKKKPRPSTKTSRDNAAIVKKGVANRTGKAADRHREILLDYISDPDNPPLTRTKLAEDVLKVNRKTLYKSFTPAEIAEIEAEGLRIRRSRLSTTSAQVDSALVRQALLGDVPAIKLYYQRFEGFSEKSTLSIEPSLDDLRAFAIAKGFDPVEYIEKYQAIKAERKS